MLCEASEIIAQSKYGHEGPCVYSHPVVHRDCASGQNVTRWHRNSPLAARKGWVAPEDARLDSGWKKYEGSRLRLAGCDNFKAPVSETSECEVYPITQ